MRDPLKLGMLFVLVSLCAAILFTANAFEDLRSDTSLVTRTGTSYVEMKTTLVTDGKIYEKVVNKVATNGKLTISTTTSVKVVNKQITAPVETAGVEPDRVWNGEKICQTAVNENITGTFEAANTYVDPKPMSHREWSEKMDAHDPIQVVGAPQQFKRSPGFDILSLLLVFGALTFIKLR